MPGTRTDTRDVAPGRVAAIACLALLLVTSIGCVSRVICLGDSQQMIHLKAGESSPCSGWLMTDEQIVDIHDALDRLIPPGEPGDAMTGASPNAE